MCGRYSITTTAETLCRLFAVTVIPNLEPRYNMAPMQTAPVIRERDGKRHMDRLRRGLVPRWAPDESRAASLINGRSETVAEKPAFRDAYARRRCLIPADGFMNGARREAASNPIGYRFRESVHLRFRVFGKRWEKGADSLRLSLCSPRVQPPKSSIFITGCR